MTDSDIPDVDDTDLTREELEEAAQECGIDPAGLDDQQLLEQLGVALGEIDESQVSAPEDGASSAAEEQTAADGGGERDEGEEPVEQSVPGEPIEGPTRNELRARLRELGLPVSGTKDELQQRLDEAQTEDTPSQRDDEGEQSLPGEPIQGPTRDELRDQLRELGLPLSGTKGELQQRLDEARDEGGRSGEQTAGSGDEVGGQSATATGAAGGEDAAEGGADGGEEDAAESDDGGGDDSLVDKIRDQVARGLARTSERVAADEDAGEDTDTDRAAAGADADGAAATAADDEGEPTDVSADTESGDADDGGGGGGGIRNFLADRVDGLADRLDGVADRVRGSDDVDDADGDGDDGGGDGLLSKAVPSKVKLAGKAIRRKLPGG